jgi:nitrite reductase/ring-hydroxylating ferredoxin subunit
MTEIRAARLDELPAGQLKRIEIEGRLIVLACVGDSVYACGDTCAHQGGPLSEGRLSGTRLACPWHGWMYDVRTGQCLMPARGASVPSYRVRVDDDAIWLDTGG